MRRTWLVDCKQLAVIISTQYAAGFFDGEGCINITVRGPSRQVCLRVMLVNTDAPILRFFQIQFGGRLAKPRMNGDGWKEFRQLNWSGHAAAAFIREIEPYLILKKPQAQLALEFWDFMQLPKSSRCELRDYPSKLMPYQRLWYRTDETLAKELDYKQRMHWLNKRGA